MNDILTRIPKWIWHQDRESMQQFELVKSFVLEKAVENVEFNMALTGAVEIELDGRVIGVLGECAANICAFQRIAAFPARLDAGEHTLRLRIHCKSVMPIVPINIHLKGRLAGCIAYLSAEPFWLSTDDSWFTGDGQTVSTVCLLGEEPYGDLEGGPEWFVAGGFGDIQTSLLHETSLLLAHRTEVTLQDGRVHMKGNARGTVPIPVPERDAKYIFYHVRKQTEWREANLLLQQTELSNMPFVVLDLGKEYNMRFRLENRIGSGLDIVWNGAESLHELENYEGLMTESFALAAGETKFTLPQGVRYVRMYVLAEGNSPFELSWQAEEVSVPMKQTGYFQTDSARLKQVFDISLHTNQVCHQIGLWDGIKRDRLNWTYDFYLAGKADYVLYGDLSVLRRSMEELGRGTPEGYWMNDLASYTLWWLNNVWEYYLHTGDQAFVLSLNDEILRHTRQVESLIDPVSHALSNIQSNLIEWVPMEQGESELCMQALFRMTGNNLRRLKSYIPELSLPGISKWGHPQMDAAAFLSGKQLITKLLGIMGGYVGEQEAMSFLENYKPEDPITPLSAYWLAECCSQLGLTEKAWAAVSAVWGKMLDEDATTCWESVTLQHEGDFHDALTTYTNYDSYRISLCHSWAGTPIHWIMSRVVGVQPVEPGYQTIKFLPQHLNGIGTCKASLPTPFGQIEAGWEHSQDFIRLPKGITLAE
ncbi:alpha-L-rhamnosidase C-terminal domain-containing protein [Paenibacillus dokdonensis]|uniref:Alpha-L-rhamnosidase C-terminal domain-containing protein n=1 Tax=Paenibacillus dokdonensis TaxID=2567944 RepID=A0ABU6GGY4_9BACL|nr:alpha-L-rhamnosidase C-terminal domain-containing protein [Paenibacillus dokdonensis]MEC0239015.1 alpha-L-rhamnosidase C-terminal domain-containing protein [Paenibacillus dokdonensis]